MKISKLEKERITELYDMVGDEIDNMCDIISQKTGYYCLGEFSIFEDEPKKCMDIELKIALLERPHRINVSKVEYYIKINPDNVIDKPILAYKHNKWYMIYDGVHRTEVNKKLGNKTIKANIIIPKPEE